MADRYQEELQGLRDMVVKLSKELDHKNRLLMQKEETRKSEHMKLQVESLKRALTIEKEKLDHKTRNEGLGNVISNEPSNKGCFKSPKTNLIVQPNERDNFSTQHNKKQDCSTVKELKELRDHNKDLEAQIGTLRKELEEKGKAVDQIGNVNHHTLVLKERSCNEELQALRREAINFLLSVNWNGTKIGMKRTGEIDPRPFRTACLKKFYYGNWEERSNDLYSSWQESLSDPSWNPFEKKIIDGKL